MSTRGVLVVGATGTQGGAVARRLLDDDHDFEVYGLTRDPSSRAARHLAERGVRIVRGNLWEPSTLVSAMEPVDAVYGMTDYWEAGSDGVEGSPRMPRTARTFSLAGFRCRANRITVGIP